MLCLLVKVTLWTNHTDDMSASLRDMPIAYHWLASGRRKRRVDAVSLSAIIDDAIAAAHDACTELDVILERPTPIPDVDGWQSAALSGAPPQPQRTTAAALP